MPTRRPRCVPASLACLAIVGLAASGEVLRDQAAPHQQSPEPVAQATVPATQPSPEEMEADVQQLVADSQNAIMSYGGAAAELTEPLRVGLEQLNAALAEKADLVARGQDVQATDRSIAALVESVRASLDALLQAQVTEQADPAPGQSGAPAESVVSRVNAFAEEALGLLQKIQEMRALFGGASEEAATAGLWEGAGEYAPDDPSFGTPPVEQPPGMVSGVVVQDGQPVVGSEVSETGTGVTTTTAGDGSYTLKPLPPNLLARLRVMRQGRLVATGQVHVVGAQATLADFQLRGGAIVTRPGMLGSTAMRRVVPQNAGTLMGRVLDPRGNAAARALVMAPGAGSVRTNRRGEFLMTGVPAGAYTVSARDSGHGVATVAVKVAGGQVPTSVTVRLAAGRALPAGPAPLLVGDRAGARVHGRIRDQDARDLPAVRVSLLRDLGTVSVLTDRRGRFAVGQIRPGQYRVVVARPGFETATRSISLKAQGDQKIELTLKQVTPLVETIRKAEVARRAAAVPAARAGVGPAARRPEVAQGAARAATDARSAPAPTKTPAGSPATKPAVTARPRVERGHVQGRVLDVRTRRPIAGATVSVSRGGSVVTDRNGSFRIENLTAGAREIAISRAGYLRQERRITVAAGKTVEVDVALRAALPLKR